MTTKKSFIDSHWLVFVLQGVISLLFGWYIMFTGSTDVRTLVSVVGVTLLGLGIIEMFNVLHRSRRKETWGLNFGIAAIEVAVALALLMALDQNAAWQLTIIAAYTLCRGVFEILIGLKSVDDSTDKFIWLVCGICGAILGFVVFNSGHFATTAFLQFFGTYMMIFGLSNLIYGVHNRDQQREYKRELSEKRKAARAKRAKKSKK